MMSLNAIKLDIDKNSYSYAKIYASLLKDEFQRKRAYASLVALYAFLNLLERTPFNIQKAMTLFRNPVLNEKFEISDLYVNNYHLDVRIVVSGNSFLVPKTHIDNGLLPDFYIVVKVDKTLENAELVGIADTTAMKTEPFDYHYNSVSFSQLISYDDFLLKIQKEKQNEFTKEDHELFNNSYLRIMDGEADQDTVNRVLKHVFACSECRTEFCCFTGFEMVSCNAGKYPELMEDQTLNIVGAQSVDDAKYAGKEEKIYIGDDEQKDGDSVLDDLNFEEAENSPSEAAESTPAAEEKSGDTAPEETVSDILDELFNVEEDFIEDENPVEKDINTKPFQQIEKISEDLSILPEQEEENILDKEEASQPADMETIEHSNDEDIVTLEHNNEEDIENISNADDTEKTSEVEELIEFNDSEELEPITDDSDENLITLNDEYEDETHLEKNENTAKNEDVQKVIIDYDETGEPVYSYITNVNKDSAIEDIPDDIDLNENSADIIENAEADEKTDDDKQEDFEEYKEDDGDDSDDSDDSDREGFSQAAILHDELLNGDDEEEGQAEETEEISDFEESPDEEDSEIEEYEGGEEETDEEDDDDNDEDDDEEYEEETEGKKGPSKLVAAVFALLVILGLAGGGAFFFMKHNSSSQDNLAQNDNNTSVPVNEQQNDDMFTPPPAPVENTESAEQNQQEPSGETSPQTEAVEIPQLTENDLVAQNNQPVSDPNKAITNAFSNGGSAYVTVNGINWNCTAELFTDKTFKAYLQHLDNLLKQNLKNNILNATETPSNNSVTAKLAINNNGDLEKVIISQSSGSAQIDNIVLQSINEMFQGEKSSILDNNTLKQDRYYLKVVIKL